MKKLSKWICLFLWIACIPAFAASISGIVIRVDANRVYIDLGENDGVNIGDEFRIVSAETQREVGRINIREVFSYASMGELTEKAPNIEIELSDPVYRSAQGLWDDFDAGSSSRMQPAKRQKIKIGFSAAAIGFAFSALYFDHVADDYYQKYKDAPAFSSEKEGYKDKTQKYDRFANIALGGSCLCAGITISVFLWD